MDIKQQKIEERDTIIKGVLSDTIRFGAAIGSWYDSQIPWNRSAAAKCIKAVEETALSEINYNLNNIDRGLCRTCFQKLPEQKRKEEDENNKDIK